MFRNTTIVLAPEAFRDWLKRAGPGQQLEYYRGYLVRDRWPTSDLSEDERQALGRLADAAWRAADEGLLDLVQRRHGEFDFSYLAIRRGHPAAAAAAVSFVQPLAAAA